MLRLTIVVAAALAFAGTAQAAHRYFAPPGSVKPHPGIVRNGEDPPDVPVGGGDGASVEGNGTAVAPGELGDWVDGIFWVPCQIAGVEVPGGDMPVPDHLPPIYVPPLVGVPCEEDPYGQNEDHSKKAYSLPSGIARKIDALLTSDQSTAPAPSPAPSPPPEPTPAQDPVPPPAPAPDGSCSVTFDSSSGDAYIARTFGPSASYQMTETVTIPQSTFDALGTGHIVPAFLAIQTSQDLVLGQHDTLGWQVQTIDNPGAPGGLLAADVPHVISLALNHVDGTMWTVAWKLDGNPLFAYTANLGFAETNPLTVWVGSSYSQDVPGTIVKVSTFAESDDTAGIVDNFCSGLSAWQLVGSVTG